MTRHAQGHAVQPGAGQVAHPSGVTDRRHQCQRSRPESLGQPPRLFIEHTHRFSGVRVRDVGDQRIEARPPLGLEDRGHGLRVRSVGPQPIDRLGRQAEQLAVRQAAGGGLDGIILMVGMFVLMLFLMIRPQMKRAKEHRSMVDALQKGDEVVAASGIVGRISKVTDAYVTLEIAPNTEINVQKMAVQTLLPKGTIKTI